VVQDTGFTGIIPAGEGVLAFGTLEEASRAIDQVLVDPPLHARAARAIASEYFDSNRVLTQLVEKALSGSP
jgi:hypothetical protein